eukprot:gene5856-4179_t
MVKPKTDRPPPFLYFFSFLFGTLSFNHIRLLDFFLECHQKKYNIRSSISSDSRRGNAAFDVFLSALKKKNEKMKSTKQQRNIYIYIYIYIYIICHRSCAVHSFESTHIPKYIFVSISTVCISLSDAFVECFLLSLIRSFLPLGVTDSTTAAAEAVQATLPIYASKLDKKDMNYSPWCPRAIPVWHSPRLLFST